MSHQRGELLNGRYRLEERIASGGMGEVWQATDTVLRRAVAVKTLHDELVADLRMRSRFRHEALAMAALHHPGIADVYDVGGEAGDAYLVMERVNGEPLDRRIAARGRLPVAGTLSIVAQVGRALQAAHDAGIVHRDVKPGNILIRPDETAVLVDFGVSFSARSTTRTDVRVVVGTAHYIAPEQVAKRAVGPPADVYALGAVAYHCLAGRPPFVGDTPVAIAMRHLSDEPPPLPADVPEPVRDLVATALAKDPAHRFPSAAAMAAAAEQAAGGTVAGEEPTVLMGRLRPGRMPTAATPDRGRHRHLLVASAGVALALVGAGTALALSHPFDAPPVTPPVTTSVPGTPAEVPAPGHTTRPADGNGAGGQQTDRGTPAGRPATTGPAPRPKPSRTRTAAPTTPPRTTAPATTPPATTAPVKPTPTTAPVKPTPTTAPVKPPATTAPVKPPATTAPVRPPATTALAGDPTGGAAPTPHLSGGSTRP